MEFIRTEIPDVVLIKPKVISDDRGYFVETFRKDKLEQFLGYEINFNQDNESKSQFGVLRGLHLQLQPYTQAKLVRVIKGKVLDVAVDLRKGSRTYGMHVAEELSEENKHQLLIPRGFAHGFVVLSEECIFAYKVDNQYSGKHECGIIYNDKSLGINWRLPEEKLKLSDKDLKLPKFEFNNLYYDLGKE